MRWLFWLLAVFAAAVAFAIDGGGAMPATRGEGDLWSLRIDTTTVSDGAKSL